MGEGDSDVKSDLPMVVAGGGGEWYIVKLDYESIYPSRTPDKGDFLFKRRIDVRYFHYAYTYQFLKEYT